MNVVKVFTGARLHFGLLCGGPASRNRFGGMGLMVGSPRWVISASLSDDCSCAAPTVEVRERIRIALPGICQHVGITGLSVVVHDEIPLHRGLGAGTQLTLALASIALVAAGLPRPSDSMCLAAKLERLRRSAVGTFGFDRGGFIVDDGQPTDLSNRGLHKYEIPDAWRIVLLSPIGAAGLSGAREESVFREDQYMEESTIHQQASLIRDVVVPAIQNRQFELFCRAIGEYGRTAGRFFAPQQGGVYSSSIVRRLSTSQEFNDLPLVQSSWGPTVATFTQTRRQAEDIVGRILGSTFADEIQCRIVEPLNCGAIVQTTAPETPDYVVRG